MPMIELLTQAHYLPLAAVLFLGGTPALVSAMYFVVTDRLELEMLLFLALSTTLLWDTLWYAAGRLLPLERLGRFRGFRTHDRFSAHFRSLAEPNRYLLLFLSRFVYGTNSLCSVVSGASSMKYLPFLLTSIGSISCWLVFLFLISSGIRLPFEISEKAFDQRIILAVFALITFVAILGLRRALRGFFPR